MELETIDAESPVSTPRSGRKKKTALLSRLAQKKIKENVSDDSDFGSHSSLPDQKLSNAEKLVDNDTSLPPVITPRQFKPNRLPPVSSPRQIDEPELSTSKSNGSGKSNFRETQKRFPLKEDTSNDADDFIRDDLDLRKLPNKKTVVDSWDSYELLPESRTKNNSKFEKLESLDSDKNYNLRRDLSDELKLPLESLDSNPESAKESEDEDFLDKSNLRAEYKKRLTSTPRNEGKILPETLSPESDDTGGSETLNVKSNSMPNSDFQSFRKSRVERVSHATFTSLGNTTSSELGSIRSMQSHSSLPMTTTKQARERSFLVGSVNKCLLGSEELERCFPDRKMTVFAATWNMNGLLPKDLPTSLNDFLLPDQIEYVPDVVAIGTQETCSDRNEWEVRLQETLGPTHVMIHSAQHGTLHQCVFMKRDLVWYCSIPEDSYLTTRKAMRTKGSVAISFSIFGTSFLFLTSHFKPHDGCLKERIEDYNKTIKNLDLPRKVILNDFAAKSEDVTARFDCVFWTGDLNFRIERPRHIVDSVMNAIAQKEHPNFEDLLIGDELYKARMEGTGFQEFQEGRINFAPTYKFDVNTDNYDTQPTLRIPSYCDRVLFRCRRKHGIECHYYDSVDTIKISDHRPVFGLYEVEVKPGRDNVPLSGGAFNRQVYIQANMRRAKLDEPSKKSEKESTVCNIQ